MPLRRENSRVFHRTLFCGQLEPIRLLKRKDNQQQGTVTAYILWDCRRSMITKTGESIQGDMVANHRTVWHIPKVELDRVGIHYLNSLDRIEQLRGEEKGSWWQPEATTDILVKLFGNHLDLSCLRVDPPTSNTPHS